MLRNCLDSHGVMVDPWAINPRKGIPWEVLSTSHMQRDNLHYLWGQDQSWVENGVPKRATGSPIHPLMNHTFPYHSYLWIIIITFPTKLEGMPHFQRHTHTCAYIYKNICIACLHCKDSSLQGYGWKAPKVRKTTLVIAGLDLLGNWASQNRGI